jgi:hypothetical protein
MTKYHVFKVVHNSFSEKIEIKFPETQQKIVGYKLGLDFSNVQFPEEMKYPSIDISKVVVMNKDGNILIDDILNFNMLKREGFIPIDVDIVENKNFVIISSISKTGKIDKELVIKITFKTV